MANWKRKIAALLLAGVSIFGVACNGDDAADDTTTEETEGTEEAEETPEGETTP